MPIVRGEDDFLPVKFSTRICLLVLASSATVLTPPFVANERRYENCLW